MEKLEENILSKSKFSKSKLRTILFALVFVLSIPMMAFGISFASKQSKEQTVKADEMVYLWHAGFQDELPQHLMQEITGDKTQVDKITSIIFQSSYPTGDWLNNTPFSVEATTVNGWYRKNDGTEKIKAFYKSNGDYYDIIIATPNGETIYAPNNSGYMFHNCSNLANIDFSNFNTSNVTTMNWMFGFCPSLTSLDLSNFDTSNVTDMFDMFNGCSSLTSLDLSSFDTSKVTDMNSIFIGCSSLTSLDLSSFDTSNVTNMGGMFYGCSSLTSLDLSSFDTSSVTSSSNFISNDENLKLIKSPKKTHSSNTISLSNGSVSYYNTSTGNKVTAIPEGLDSSQTYAVKMKVYAKASSGVFDNRNGWTTEDDDCSSLEFYYNSVIGALPVVSKSGNTFIGWYTNTDGSGQAITSTSKVTFDTIYAVWKVEKYYLFNGGTDGTCFVAYLANKLSTELQIGDQNPSIFSSITFQSAYPTSSAWSYFWIETLDVDGNAVGDSTPFRCYYKANGDNYDIIIASNGVTMYAPKNCSYMFYACTSMQNITFSNILNTSEVEDMSNMFLFCNRLTSLDLTSFNTSKVKTMDNMFSSCSKLQSINLTSFDTSSLNDMHFMFSSCSSLTSLNLTSFDTSNVTDVSCMFFQCTGIKGSFGTSSDAKIRISESFTTENVTNFSMMFLNCSGLTSIDLSNFDTSNANSTLRSILSGCVNLTTIKTPKVIGEGDYISLNEISTDYYVVDATIEVQNRKKIDVLENEHSNKTFKIANTVYAITINGKFDTSNATLHDDNNYYCEDGWKIASGRTNAYKIVLFDEQVGNFSTVISEVSGYIVESWNTSQDGTGDKITETETIESDITIYAQWNNFLYNGGESDVNSYLTSYIISQINSKENITKTTENILSIKFQTDYPTTEGHIVAGYSETKSFSVGATTYDNSGSMIDDDSPFKCYYKQNGNNYDIIIASGGRIIYAPKYSQSMFYGCKNLVSLDISILNTSFVENMSYMFAKCSSLTELDVSHFNTSNVTDMSYMFFDLSNVEKLDMRNFDTRNVTDMSNMFYSVRISGKFGGTNDSAIQIGTNFKTDNVVDMNGMFSDCSNLTTIDVTSFDTSNVTNMFGMFSTCCSISSLNLLTFNTSKVTDMSSMFRGLDLTILNLSGFDTSNVTDMSQMFYECSKLTTINIGSFNTSKVTNMSYMFNCCKKIENLNLSNFDTSNVTNMSYMFSFCSELTAINLSSFNTPKLRSMNDIFEGCSKLEEIDLSSFDTSNVKLSVNANKVFDDCTSLKTIKTPKTTHGTRTINLPTIEGMNFYDASSDVAVKDRVVVTAIEKGLNNNSRTYKIGYIVTADANEGTITGGDGWKVAEGGETATKVVTFDEAKIGALPVADKTYSELDGWFTSAEGGDEITINTAVSADTNIFAHWTITNIDITSGSVEISGSVVYGNTLTAIVKDQNGDVDNTENAFVYTWKYLSGGEYVEIAGANSNTLIISAETFGINTVAGTKIILVVSGNESAGYVGTIASEESDIVAQKSLEWSTLPTVESRSYIKNNTTAIISSHGSISGILANDDCQLDTTNAQANFVDANVGEDKEVIFAGYALSGSNSANYLLSQPTGIKANITKAVIDYLINNIDVQYDGNEHGLTVVVNTPDDATILYGLDENNFDLSESPTKVNAGYYIVYVKITADNFEDVITTRTINISKKIVQVDWLNNSPYTYQAGVAQYPTISSISTGVAGETFAYTASYQVKNTEAPIEKEDIINAKSYIAIANIQNVVGGNANLANYDIQNTTIDFVIEPQKLKIPKIEGVYTFKADVYSENDIVWNEDFDASLMTIYNITPSPVAEAGDYEVILALTSNNYVWEDQDSERVSIGWTISPYEIEIEWDEFEDVQYNGNAQYPTATKTVSQPEYIVVDVAYYDSNNQAIDKENIILPGTYSAVANISMVIGKYNNSDNYTLSNNTTTFEIKVAKFQTPSNLSWNIGVANWDEVESIGIVDVSYIIQLFKDNSPVGQEISVSQNTYDFTNIIKTDENYGKGTYTFKLKTISGDSNVCLDSDWSSDDDLSYQYVSSLSMQTNNSFDCVTIQGQKSYILINGENNLSVVAEDITGLDFKKWESNSQNISIDDVESTSTSISYSTNASETLTLTAMYDAVEFVVEFGANNGNGQMDSVTLTYDKAYTLPENKFERDGYTFDGWSTTIIGSKMYEDKQELTAEEVNALYVELGEQDGTLFAVWKIAEYNITYILGEGEILPEGYPTKYNVTTPTFTLKNPTKQGYEFTGWTGSNGEEPQTTVEIAKGTTGDKEYTANWIAKNDTKYTVEHYIQNFDETYSIYETENLTGTTDKEIDIIPMTIEGFTARIDNPTKIVINADESSVAKLYYTRNKYQFTLIQKYGVDLTGSTLSGEIYYDATITLTAQEIDGYKWNGWLADYEELVWGVNGSPAKETTFKMPASAVTITPDISTVEYEIEYDLDGGHLVEGKTNPEKYTVTDEFTLVNPERDGYNFDGWLDAEDNNLGKEVTIEVGTTGNKLFKATWQVKGDTHYEIEYYLMNLDGSDYTKRETESYDDGFADTNIDLSDYVKIFEGFTSADFNESTLYINSDGSSVAKLYYTRNKYQFKLTQVEGVDATSTVENGEIYFGTEITLTAQEIAGYKWQKWSNEQTDMQINITMPAGNFEICAVVEKEVYGISYELNGGIVAVENPATYTVTDEFTLVNPTKQGYTFAGWTGSNGEEPQTTVEIAKGTTGDKEYTANWIAKNDTKYKIEYYLMDLNGDYSNEPSETENLTGTTDKEVDIVPMTIEGFTAKIDNPTKIVINADESSVAKLYYTRNKYQFKLTQVEGVNATSTVENGEIYYETEITLTAQEISGYKWQKWSNEQTDMQINITMPAGNFEICAVVEKEVYSISYELNGGTFVVGNPTTYTVTDEFMLNKPERDGYSFDGWLDAEDNKLGKEVTIEVGTTGNKLFKATWQVKGDTHYEIEYYLMNVDGNNYLKHDTILFDDGIADTNVDISDYVKTYEGFTPANDNELTLYINGNGSSVAKLYYTRNKYQFTLNQVEGVDLTESTLSGEVYFGATIILKAKVGDGYTLSDWIVDYENLAWKDNGELVEERIFSMPASDVSITPDVKKNVYTIQYDLSGGQLPEGAENPLEYTVTDEFTLVNPTKQGYDFAGWTESNSNIKQINVTLINQHENKVYTAHWKARNDTKYTVKHYQMGIDGQYSTEPFETDVLYDGETDAEVTPETKQYKGFKTPNPKTDIVLADGSTCIEYYYERKTYEISWDWKDGLHIVKTQVYYGAMPSYEGETPTKASDEQFEYTFVSWSPELKVVDGAKTYNAQYDSTEKMYNLKIVVVYSVSTIPTLKITLDNETDDTVIIANQTSNEAEFDVRYRDTVLPRVVLVDNGKEYNMVWNENNISTDKKLSLSHNGVFISSDATISLFVTEIFDINVLSSNETMGLITSNSTFKALYGKQYTNISAEPNNGYKFVGWTTNDGTLEIVDSTSNVATIRNVVQNTDLIANFEIENYVITIKIDNDIQTISYNINSDDIVIDEISKDGYEFKGWIEKVGDEPKKQVIISSGSYGDRTLQAVFELVDVNYLPIIIIGSALLVGGLATTLIIVLKKHKRKQNKRKSFVIKR